MRQPTALLFALLLALLLAGTPLAAFAQSCTSDTEPNEQPPQAAPAAIGCVEGALQGGDQDFFAFQFGPAEAAQRWTLAAQGVAGQTTTVQMFLLPADGGAPKLVAKLDLPAGAAATTDDLILLPGAYVVGVSASGAGAYRLDWQAGVPLPPNGEVEPNDDYYSTPTPLTSAFALAGDLQGSADYFQWTVSDLDAQQRWRFAVRAPLGVNVYLTIDGPPGWADLSGSTEDGGAFTVFDLGLLPGVYSIGLSPAQEQGTPYTLTAEPTGMRAPDLEEEPNDRFDLAYPLDPTQPLQGTLLTPRDNDYYRFAVDDAFAAQQWSLTVNTEQPGDLYLCLLDDAGVAVQCREGARLALPDLALKPGDYGVELRDRTGRLLLYTLQFERMGETSADFEAEPNDLVNWASPLNADNALRGRLVGSESDYLRFTVSGAPQLWRVQVAGDGLERLDYVDITGLALQTRQAEGGRRIRLENLYLLPGDHYLRVAGQDGKYTVRAVSLGAPAAAPIPVAEQAGSVNATAAVATADFDAGPPPVPVTEREPNDYPDLALRIDPGTTQSGRLSEGDERDVYRFHLPAAAIVRLSVLPPPDAAVDMNLDNILSHGNAGAGQPYNYVARLPAGDHFVTLTPNPRSDQPYQFWLARENWFAPPADLEPANNAALTAPQLAGSGMVTGMLDNSDASDYYRLPSPLPAAQNPVTLTLEGALWGVEIYSGAERLDLLARQPDNLTFTGVLPEAPLALRVNGTSAYTLGVELAGLPASTPSPLPILLGAAPAPVVAAYWPDGQQVAWTLVLTNTGAAAETVDLDFYLSDARWQADPTQLRVTVDAGTTVTVPVRLAVLYDAPPGPVAIDVRARSATGAVQVASFDLTALCGVAPVAPDRTVTTAGALLGGLNAAWSGLGGQPLGDDPARLAPLFDGIVAPSTGYRGEVGSTVTVVFTSTQPVPVAGVLLNPFGSTPAPDTVRDFAVATSLDGIAFTPIYTGTADLLPLEQSFPFSQPVDARFVRLTLLSSHNDYPYGIALGEFKVVVAPGADIANGQPFNLADPAVGGHVVMGTPLLNDPQLMLLDDQKQVSMYAGDLSTPITWTLGFHHNRAAQIVALEWQNAAAGDPAQRVSAVAVAASVDSPLGPWTSLGTWTLDPAATTAQRLSLPAPQWARFVQFSTPKPDGASYVDFPAVLRVIERSQDTDYTSILAEYGEYRQAAAYELQQAVNALQAAPQAAGNQTRETATVLSPSTAVQGTVETDVRTGWYRIDVPEGQNVLAVSVTGEPALAVAAALSDAVGAPVEVERAVAGNTLQLVAAVKPGAYYLQVSEPLRSVAFTWDTSGSVGPYTNIIYQALARFTAAIDPQREVVNLLPFGEPGQFLLPDWSSDPGAVQAALTRYPRQESSSNAELNLLTATEALAARDGTRAVLLITDAESNGYDQTPALWAALDRVRPRIFSFEISSGGNAASQDLMQDWAGANAGHYAHVTSIGDMEVGFERAACLLRRPAMYTVVAELRSATSPVPTSTPTPVAIPTSVLQGEGAVVVTAPAAAADPASPPAAASGAIEIILDASGSMLQRMDGRPKIDVARDVLIALVNNELPPGALLALRVFGNRETDSCRTDLELALQPLDHAVATQLLEGITAINLARTPIADSLRLVAEDLAAATGPRIIVLVTDGEETCGGDPEQVIRDLRAQGYDVRVNIVGFDVADPALQETFQQWANLGGGLYFNAANANELGNAVTQAVRPSYRIVDGAGNVVATGVVGGEPVAVPAGVYTVEVDSFPPARFEQVIVADGATVELEIASSTANE